MTQGLYQEPYRKKIPLCLGAAFILMSILSAPYASLALASPQSAQERDEWYVIRIAGKNVGYVHEELEIQPGALLTTSETRMALNRLGSRVEISFFSTTEESKGGFLRRAKSAMTASNQTTNSEAIVKEGAIELRSGSGGKSYTRTLNYTGEIFGPEGIRQASRELRKPGDSLAIQTFIAEASLITKLSRTVIGRDVVRFDGREIPTTKAEEIYEGMPIKRTIWLDKQGLLVKQEEPGPFGLVEALRSDREAALAAVSKAEELPEEIYRNSIIRTNIRLPGAEPIDRLKIRITHRKPELGWPNLEAHNQEVLEKADKTLVLEIRRHHPPEGASFPVVSTERNREYLAPNAYIQADDPEIQRLAHQVIGGEKDLFKAALALERWVAENMKFDLGIVFAPATEIYRDRRGTCVGYATLLATLARAAGIPSRIVMGYVYALGMFGGHAWTELLVGEEWVPLDAALVNEGAADAKRFFFAASALAGGLGEIALGPAQQVFGQVDLEILEYETAGETFAVPAGQKAFSVDGDFYRNPYLGIELRKPAEMIFTGLDAVWPDPTFVKIEGSSGVEAALEQHQIYPWQKPEEAVWENLEVWVPEGRREKSSPFGKDTYVIAAQDGRKAALGISRGSELLIWKVRGENAPQRLTQIMENFRLKGSAS